MKGIATPAYRPAREDPVFGDFFDSLRQPFSRLPQRVKKPVIASQCAHWRRNPLLF